MTLLMVTHDADAAAIAGRQIRLEHGKLMERTAAAFAAAAVVRGA